jgi:tryptophan-rich sensory protein
MDHVRPSPRRRPVDWLVLGGIVLICQLAGFAGSQSTDPGFYREIARPSWAPPGWVFAPVWITLYAMMGLAAWLVWTRPRSSARTAALAAFAVQLLLNALWTPVFFGQRSIGGGLAVIVALDLALWVTIALFRRSSVAAAWLMAPYAAWVGFATVLNAWLWQHN